MVSTDLDAPPARLGPDGSASGTDENRGGRLPLLAVALVLAVSGVRGRPASAVIAIRADPRFPPPGVPAPPLSIVLGG